MTLRQLGQQSLGAVHLVEGFANDRRVHGDRAVLRGIEPIAARDRVDVPIEHQTDDIPVASIRGLPEFPPTISLFVEIQKGVRASS